MQRPLLWLPFTSLWSTHTASSPGSAHQAHSLAWAQEKKGVAIERHTAAAAAASAVDLSASPDAHIGNGQLFGAYAHRQVLWQRHAHLRAGHSALPFIISLTGVSSTGKSRLALRYAHITTRCLTISISAWLYASNIVALALW